MIRIHSLTNWRSNYESRLTGSEVILDAIVPKFGTTLRVEISRYEYAVEGDANLLWCPPDSELNGWECRPSEILHSYIVEGYLSEEKNGVFSCNIKSVTPLLDVLESATNSGDFSFPRCGEVDGTSFNLWERAYSVQSAAIGRYIYLSGSECETSLEAIFIEGSSGLTLLYHAMIPPATTETVITQHALSTEEQALFRKLINGAEKIVESSACYLV